MYDLAQAVKLNKKYTNFKSKAEFYPVVSGKCSINNTALTLSNAPDNSVIHNTTLT